MESDRFDGLTRTVSMLLSRRAVAGALGLGALALPGLADARKKHKRKKKKVKFNDFGCVKVGDFCQNDDQCCSGICQGKKGKSKCRAHDSGTGCQAGDQDSFCGGIDVECITATGITGVCETTTGNAGYCDFGFACFPCRKDADCQRFCGPASACLRCAAFCPDTGGTACGLPTEDNCPE